MKNLLRLSLVLVLLFSTYSAFSQALNAPMTAYKVDLLPEGSKMSEWVWEIDWVESYVVGSNQRNAAEQLAVWLAVAHNYSNLEEMSLHYYNNYTSQELLEGLYRMSQNKGARNASEMLSQMLDEQAKNWHLVYKPLYRKSTINKFD